MRKGVYILEEQSREMSCIKAIPDQSLPPSSFLCGMAVTATEVVWDMEDMSLNMKEGQL